MCSLVSSWPLLLPSIPGGSLSVLRVAFASSIISLLSLTYLSMIAILPIVNTLAFILLNFCLSCSYFS